MINLEGRIQVIELDIARQTPGALPKVIGGQVIATGSEVTEEMLFKARFAKGNYLDSDRPNVVNTGIIIQDKDHPAIIKETSRFPKTIKPNTAWGNEQVWD